MLLLEHLFNFASFGHGTKITVTCRNHYSDDACLYPEVGDDLGLGVQQLQKVNVLQVTHSMLVKTKNWEMNISGDINVVAVYLYCALNYLVFSY